MEFITTLLGQQPLVALFLTIAIGYLVGEINVKGFSLGVGAVLFVALFMGWFAPKSVPRSSPRSGFDTWIQPRRSGSWIGRGRSTSGLAMLNSSVFAPTASASVSSVIGLYPGERRIVRMPTTRSIQTRDMSSLPAPRPAPGVRRIVLAGAMLRSD